MGRSRALSSAKHGHAVAYTCAQNLSYHAPQVPMLLCRAPVRGRRIDNAFKFEAVDMTQLLADPGNTDKIKGAALSLSLVRSLALSFSLSLSLLFSLFCSRCLSATQ